MKPIADEIKPALELVPDTSSMSAEEQEAHFERAKANMDRYNATVREGELRAKRQRYLDAGFPVRALEAALRADTQRPVIERVAAWVPSERGILVLGGPVGCGKSVAGTWWALRAPVVPLFLRASTFAATSRYDAKHRATVFAAPALVLDDLGAEYLDDKGSFLVDLDELFDTYYSNRRPLLITTNLDRRQFGQRYGARVCDRLRESGAFWETKSGSLRGSVAP